MRYLTQAQDYIYDLEKRLDHLNPSDFDSYEDYEEAVIDLKIEISNVSYDLTC